MMKLVPDLPGNIVGLIASGHAIEDARQEALIRQQGREAAAAEA